MTQLVTFGETMLRFSTPEGERLETAEAVDLRTAGAESNVAIAAARLDADAAWLSKLPDSALGRRVVYDVRSHGVEPLVVWSDEHRQGTYYIEQAGPPRGTNVIYDRGEAAITTAEPSELPTERLESADTFYTSGITPALSETLCETTATLLREAHEHGTRTVFDLNYRSKLWSPAEAARTCLDLLDHVDTLVVARRDVETVLGATRLDLPLQADPGDLAAALRSACDLDAVVLTRGSDGATGATQDAVVHQDAFEAATVDAIGTGDAFVGGYLARRLQGGDFADAIQYGAATAALKRTILGDLALVTPVEVERVLAEAGRGIDR